MKVTIEMGGGNMCFIRIPEEVATKLISEGHKRVICQVDERFEFHCAILRSKAIGHYIGMGKKILKRGHLSNGQEIEVNLLPDNTKYQAEIPEELQEVLKSDFEGSEKFHQLSLGKQRSIIYMVTAVKSPDKRIDRAIKIIENLKIGITNNRDLLK